MSSEFTFKSKVDIAWLRIQLLKFTIELLTGNCLIHLQVIYNSFIPIFVQKRLNPLHGNKSDLHNFLLVKNNYFFFLYGLYNGKIMYSIIFRICIVKKLKHILFLLLYSKKYISLLWYDYFNV